MFKPQKSPFLITVQIIVILLLLSGTAAGVVGGLAQNFENHNNSSVYNINNPSTDQDRLLPIFVEDHESKPDYEESELDFENRANQIIKILKFPTPHIQIEGEYSRLISSNLSPGGAFGDPELFTMPVNLKFEPKTVIDRIEFIPDEIFIEQLERPLMPVQEPTPVSDLAEVYSYGVPEPTQPNMNIYSSPEPFPNQWFTTDKGMGIDYDTEKTTLFFNVRIYPVRYLPLDNELMFTTGGVLNIDYTIPDKSNDLTYHGSSDPIPLSSQYTILIIGPEIFRQNLTRLAEYKNGTGLPSKFVSISEIQNGKYFTPQGDDTQEEIKYFIFNAFKTWNITYVILGGDTPLVPHRNAYIHGEEGDVPADLYYSDLYDSEMKFCDWDYDNDGTYGEYNNGNIDRADLYADVIIGRLPASTNQELEVLVNKIINYESFASGQPWFDNVTMCGTDTFSGTGTPEGEFSCEKIEERYLDGFVTTKIYETTTYERDLSCTSSNIVATLNKGAGFATFHDHGSPTSWAGVFSSSNAASLTNGDKLPFLNFDACSTGYFDRSGGDCIAEVVMLNANGGSITAIGASRIGYGQWGEGHITRYSGYFNLHLYHNYYNGEGTAGRITESSKKDYLDTIPISNFPDFKTIVEYTLFGDPSLSVGGIPLQNINISCDNNQSYVDPSGSVEYTIKVENNGTFSRPIKLYVSGEPDGWSAKLNETLVVVPGKSERFLTLTVNCSELAVFNEMADIEVYAFYSKNKDRTISVITRSITSRIYGMDINTTIFDDSVFPGEEASFWFRISNFGNAEDTINITAEFTKPLDGWDIDLSQNYPKLEPYGSLLVVVKVTPPLDALFDTYGLNISAKLIGFSGEKSSDKLSYNIKVKHIYGIDFEIEEELSKTYQPGESVTYHLNVNNMGNYIDTFKFSILMQPKEWNLSLSKSGKFDIEAFNKTTEQLNFKIPNQTLVGKYSIKIRAQSRTNYTILEDITLEVKINRTYGINLTLDSYKATAKPGETKEFNISISHLGNDKDELEFTILNLPTYWYSNITDAIEVEPFNSYKLKIQITPHLEAIVGSYIFQLKVVLMGNYEELYTNLSITISQINGFEFRCPLNNFSVEAGSTQKYSLFFENYGNHDDEVILNVTNVPENWYINWTPIDIMNSNVNLGPFKHTYANDISLKVISDTMTIASTYTIFITGKLKSTGEEIKVPIYLTIKPRYGVDLDKETNDELHIHPGEEVTIKINITNEGNTRDEISRNISGIPVGWELLTPKTFTHDIGPYETVTEVLRFDVPDTEYERDVNITIKINSNSNPEHNIQDRSIIYVEERPIPKDDDTNNWGNINFESAVYTWILPLVLLIVVGSIFGFVMFKQYKENKDDNATLQQIDDDFDDMDNYDYEAERLYGKEYADRASMRARRSRGGRRIPPPPPQPMGVKSQAISSRKGKSMRWLDDEQDQRLPAESDMVDEDDDDDLSLVTCPACGELVSLDDYKCPYCGEVFEDLDEEFDEDIDEDDVAEDWDEDDESEAEEWEEQDDEFEDEELEEDEEFEFELDEDEADIESLEDDEDIDWE